MNYTDLHFYKMRLFSGIVFFQSKETIAKQVDFCKDFLPIKNLSAKC